jgi:hydroxymethylbilane synthase
LMDELKRTNKQTNVYSTKALTEDQKHLLAHKITVKSSDFIKVSLNRIPKTVLKSNLKNVIITSKNAVEALTTNFSPDELKFKNIYCVGRRTKQLIEQKIGKVTHSESSAKNLANYLVDYMEGTEITYFCSNLRLDDLPTILEKNNITVNEVEAYQTVYSSVKVDESTEGIMFYSPSTVQSYILQNKAKKIAFCIGDTTAEEAKKHFKDVRVAKVPTVESVIELVNEHYV